MERLGIHEFYCPTTRNLLAQGNSLSEDFLFIELNVLKCTSSCPGDLADKINGLTLDVPFVNTFFDFDDYNDPVKTYIDGRLAYNGLATNI